MKKIAILAVIAMMALTLLAGFSTSADAYSTSALNQGSCNAHVSGMPSVDGHIVPGLASSTFAGAEVPGHMHVPDPPGC